MWLPVLDLTARGVMTDGWRLVPTLVVPCLSPSSHLHVPAMAAPPTGPDQPPLDGSQELEIQVAWQLGATECPR